MFAESLHLISAFFDRILSPFSGMSPYVGLTVLSVITGIVMVFLYKWTTDQEKLRQVRDRIKILFLEIRLYKDDMAEMFSIQKDILRENFRYLRYTFKSAVLLILPILFILVDMNVRYGYRPVRPGETFVVSAFTEEPKSLEEIDLSLPPGLALDVPAIRVPREKRVSWQVRAGSAGAYDLAFHQGSAAYTRTIVVSHRIERAYPETTQGDSWTSRLIPEAQFIPAGSPIREVRVEYPEREGFLGLQPGWLYYFFLVSIIAGLIVKKKMGLA